MPQGTRGGVPSHEIWTTPFGARRNLVLVEGRLLGCRPFFEEDGQESSQIEYPISESSHIIRRNPSSRITKTAGRRSRSSAAMFRNPVTGRGPDSKYFKDSYRTAWQRSRRGIKSLDGSRICCADLLMTHRCALRLVGKSKAAPAATQAPIHVRRTVPLRTFLT